MSKKELIDKTIIILEKLPHEKIAEVNHFADFILQRSEDEQLLQGIAHLTAQSKSYEFLADDEELYTLNDIKEPYNGKG